MSRFTLVVSSTVLMALSGCANMPSGPGVMVLPGAGMSFDRFSNDNAACQQFALAQVGGTSANQAGINSGVASAAVGTAIGAAYGAAVGGGKGAAIGAGTGLLAGGLVGTGTASSSMEINQQRYDAAFVQCMYAKGHQVPVSGQLAPAQPQIAPVVPMPPPPPDAITPAESGTMPTQYPESGANIPPPPADLPSAPPLQ